MEIRPAENFNVRALPRQNSTEPPPLVGVGEILELKPAFFIQQSFPRFHQFLDVSNDPTQPRRRPARQKRDRPHDELFSGFDDQRPKIPDSQRTSATPTTQASRMRPRSLEKRQEALDTAAGQERKPGIEGERMTPGLKKVQRAREPPAR